jgi:hypothetical protein
VELAEPGLWACSTLGICGIIFEFLNFVISQLIQGCLMNSLITAPVFLILSHLCSFGSSSSLPFLVVLTCRFGSIRSGNNIGHDGSLALCSALASLTSLETLDLRYHVMQRMALDFHDQKAFINRCALEKSDLQLLTQSFCALQVQRTWNFGLEQGNECTGKLSPSLFTQRPKGFPPLAGR